MQTVPLQLRTYEYTLTYIHVGSCTYGARATAGMNKHYLYTHIDIIAMYVCMYVCRINYAHKKGVDVMFKDVTTANC